MSKTMRMMGNFTEEFYDLVIKHRKLGLPKKEIKFMLEIFLLDNLIKDIEIIEKRKEWMSKNLKKDTPCQKQ